MRPTGLPSVGDLSGALPPCPRKAVGMHPTTGSGPSMRPSIKSLVVLLAASLGLATAVPAQNPPKLLIAFASYRDRPKHPNIFFYEHDGIASGKILGKAGTPTGATAEGHPSLSQDGRYCAFTFELENNTGQIYFWDRSEERRVGKEWRCW